MHFTAQYDTLFFTKKGDDTINIILDTDSIKKIIRLFAVAMSFLCLMVIQGIETREAHQYIFMLGMIVFFGLLLRNIWLTLFLWWSVFLFAFFRFGIGWNYVANIFYGCILYYIVKVAFDKEHIDWFINKILWLLVINLLYGIVQLCGYDFIYLHAESILGFLADRTQAAPIGFMSLTSSMAMLITFCLPLVMTRPGKFSLIPSCMLFIPLYYLHCAAAFIASIVVFLFVAWFRLARKIFYVLVFTCSIMGILFLAKVHIGGVERFSMWRMAMEDAVKHPVIGNGLDSFRSYTQTKPFVYTDGVPYRIDGRSKPNINTWDNPHNLYISLAYEFGIFVPFILLGGYLKQVIRWFKFSDQSRNVVALAGVLIAFFITSGAQFSIFLTRMAVILIPIFALYEIATQPK